MCWTKRHSEASRLRCWRGKVRLTNHRPDTGEEPCRSAWFLCKRAEKAVRRVPQCKLDKSDKPMMSIPWSLAWMDPDFFSASLLSMTWRLDTCLKAWTLSIPMWVSRWTIVHLVLAVEAGCLLCVPLRVSLNGLPWRSGRVLRVWRLGRMPQKAMVERLHDKSKFAPLGKEISLGTWRQIWRTSSNGKPCFPACLIPCFHILTEPKVKWAYDRRCVWRVRNSL